MSGYTIAIGDMGGDGAGKVVGERKNHPNTQIESDTSGRPDDSDDFVYLRIGILHHFIHNKKPSHNDFVWRAFIMQA